MNISIVIPVYNVSAYIAECLSGIMHQRMQDGVECILVDDCGQDDSIRIAEQLIRSYAGPISFTILHHEHNRGQSAARNTGLREARGEYIYFLDSDDTITPDCLSSFWQIACQHPGIDLVQGTTSAEGNQTGYVYPDRLRAYTRRDYLDDRHLIRQILLDSSCVPVTPWNRLIRRCLLMDNDIFFHEGIIYEDVPWTFFLSRQVSTVAFNAQPTYRYRVNPTGTMSARTERSHRCWNTGFADMLSGLASGGWERHLELKFIMNWIMHYQWNYPDNPLEAGDYKDLALYRYFLHNNLNRISSSATSCRGIVARLIHYLLKSILI